MNRLSTHASRARLGSVANKSICLLMALSAATVSAQEQSLMLSDKTYTLKHALAYETTIDNEEAIAVVLSAQAISSEQLKEAREAEKSGSDGEFRRPFLRLVFKRTGELKH